MKKESFKGGIIRQRSDGCREARYTEGRDPDTSKRMQRSVCGVTKNEARQKMI